MSFTDQVYFGCIPRAAHVDNRIVKEKQKLFLNLISTNTDVKSVRKNKNVLEADKHTYT